MGVTLESLQKARPDYYTLQRNEGIWLHNIQNDFCLSDASIELFFFHMKKTRSATSKVMAQ